MEIHLMGSEEQMSHQGSFPAFPSKTGGSGLVSTAAVHFLYLLVSLFQCFNLTDDTPKVTF